MVQQFNHPAALKLSLAVSLFINRGLLDVLRLLSISSIVEAAEYIAAEKHAVNKCVHYITLNKIYLADAFIQSVLQYVHSTMKIQPRNSKHHAST